MGRADRFRSGRPVTGGPGDGHPRPAAAAGPPRCADGTGGPDAHPGDAVSRGGGRRRPRPPDRRTDLAGRSRVVRAGPTDQRGESQRGSAGGATAATDAHDDAVRTSDRRKWPVTGLIGTGPQAEEMVAREAVREQLHAYCRAMDRMDHALGYKVWHEDGLADY